MNTSTVAHTVYIQYTVDYVVGADLVGAKPLTTYFYDTTGCNAGSSYTVPGGGGAGSIHSKSISYTAPKNRTRVLTTGHLHDGGIDTFLTQNGTEICRNTASYSMDMLHSISVCETPVAVTAGMTIGLTSRYSNEFTVSGAMGISVSYVWES